MVDRPVTITYDELLARPMVEADVTLDVRLERGRRRPGRQRPVARRAASTTCWREAGVDPGPTRSSAARSTASRPGSRRSILDGRDALVAVGMNGEPLPVEHGFPARLIVPGLYGYVSATKWLSEIELTRFDEFEGVLGPPGLVRRRVRSRPSPASTCPATAPSVDTGQAGRGRRGGMGPGQGHHQGRGPGGRRTVGGGDPRRGVHRDFVAAVAAPRCTPAGGRHAIRVRATDGDGHRPRPPSRRPPNPTGRRGGTHVRIEGG